MKVFSKSNRNNRSAPALPVLPLHTKPQQPRPKGTHKIKIFKHLLTQQMHQSTNKTPFSHQYAAHHSTRDCSIQLQTISPPFNTPKLQMTSSTECLPVSGMSLSVNEKWQGTTGSRMGWQGRNNQMMNQSSKLSVFSQQSYHSASSDKQNSYRGNNFEDSRIYGFAEPLKVRDQQNQGKRMNHYKNNCLLNQCLEKTVIRRKEPSLKDFRVGKKIGKGRFGSVYLAQERRTGLVVALKMVDIEQVKQEQMEEQIVEEIKLQLFMKHPNILSMYGFFREGKQVIMILEYATDKCLFTKISKMLPEKDVAYYARQMTEALKYCHSEDILHRDLKPQNILLNFGVAKLADFGWAAYSPQHQRITFCGTLDYVPPEILKGHRYDKRVDIWSLGVLIYEMACAHAPFQTHPSDPAKTQEMTMNRIVEGDLHIPDCLAPPLSHLIKTVLNNDPLSRPTLSDIEQSEWMRSFVEEGVDISKRIWQFWSDMLDQ